MKEIPLTQGKVAIVDDEDYKWLNQWKWCMDSGGYAKRSEKRSETKKQYRREILMHRFIMDSPEGREDAASAYDEMAKKLHGKYASLNFTEGV